MIDICSRCNKVFDPCKEHKCSLKGSGAAVLTEGASVVFDAALSGAGSAAGAVGDVLGGAVEVAGDIIGGAAEAAGAIIGAAFEG